MNELDLRFPELQKEIFNSLQEKLIEASQEGVTEVKFTADLPINVYESGHLSLVGEMTWPNDQITAVAEAVFGETAVKEFYESTGLLSKHWVAEKYGQSFPFIARAKKVSHTGAPTMDLVFFYKDDPSFGGYLDELKNPHPTPLDADYVA